MATIYTLTTAPSCDYDNTPAGRITPQLSFREDGTGTVGGPTPDEYRCYSSGNVLMPGLDHLVNDTYLVQAVQSSDGTVVASDTCVVDCQGNSGGGGGGSGGGTTPTPGPVTGCTDPAATNYDKAATVEGGTCTYTPPVLSPYFAVPLLQALRFVVRGGGRTFDEVLFCEQTRPGQQLRPYFYQPVEFTDTVRVQVLTTYSAVKAEVYLHGGSLLRTVALQQVLTLEGNATPLAVTLSEDKTTGMTRLSAAAGGSLPASLLGAARLTLAGAAAGTYRLTSATAASLVHLDDYVVLNRPWVAVSGAVTATWRLTGAGFNVWEADLPLAGLGPAYYQVKLRATASGWPDQLAESEPISLRASHPKTIAVDYCNADNCFGLVFSTGLTPRLRVPGTFFRQTNGGAESSYRDSAGSLTVLSSTAQRKLQLETYGLPAWLHEKLFLACRLDYLVVENVRCQTDQAYETSEVRPYPLSAGRVALEQINWLGKGNGDDAGVLEEAPENALQLRDTNYLLLRGR